MPSPSFTAMVFPRPAGAFLSVFFCGAKLPFLLGFRSYVRQFFAAFWCLLRPSLPWCFLVRQVNHQYFLWVAEVTLGSFWLLFGAFSVLHCHGVSPSGRYFFLSVFFCREKLPCLFLLGFRSYVRQFFAAFWCLLRPSLPWCFPVRQVLF